ncbi:hypothetical protein BG910_01995 [Neisseria chenwenguii]|uniref:Uncharacterized protein n=1 Tax=Neisseria chenwenguii TaxID=1853278 RepID=A0A220RZM8_9NEIS|nr:hypothetical protein BG910_01995 [Neisseria chenwenguii]
MLPFAVSQISAAQIKLGHQSRFAFYRKNPPHTNRRGCLKISGVFSDGLKVPNLFQQNISRFRLFNRSKIK